MTPCHRVQAFSFKQKSAGPTPPSGGSLQGVTSASVHNSPPPSRLQQPVTEGIPSPSSQPLPQSLPAANAISPEQQAACDIVGLTASPRPPTRRSLRRTSSPSSSTAPVATKKRKAYASLTGPPRGLGPKLGTVPLRLILVRNNHSC